MRFLLLEQTAREHWGGLADRAATVQLGRDDLVRHLVEGSPDAQLLVDREGIIRYSNRQAQALFGDENVSLTGNPFGPLIPGLSLTDPDPSDEAPPTQGFIARPELRVRQGLFNVQRCGGETAVLDIHWCALPAPAKPPLLALVVRDVTDSQRLIGELASARRRAEEAHELKARFLAAASHDLRQPLQSVLFINGALRRQNSDPLLQDMLEEERRGLESLSKLLSTLLNIVQLESGALPPTLTEVPIRTLFEELRSQFVESSTHKGLGLRIEAIDATLLTDSVLLQQLLQNLISNAIRYTDAGEVTLRAVAGEAGELRIEVLDTGIGIPLELREHIFDDFYQIDPIGAGHRGGSGLGLGIVRRIADLLQLPLAVRSQVGLGTSMAITVPRAARAAPAASKSAVSQTLAPVLSGHILLVEDDAAVRDSLRRYLRLDGHDVTAVATLEELDRVFIECDRAPDLIVTDFHLGPSERGTDAIDRVESRFGGSLAAIVLTGDTSSLPERVLERRKIRLLNKPVVGQLLSTTIQELLADQQYPPLGRSDASAG